MQQVPQLAVLRILDNGFRSKRGYRRYRDLCRCMRGEVVEVDSFVGAAGCEDYFLGLVRNWSRGRREGEASYCRCMGIE
jgi:hypothetical protein